MTDMPDIKFEWDGEKVKRTVAQIVEKHSTKEILDVLANTKNQRKQFEDQLKKLETNRKQLEDNIKMVDERLRQLEEFESRCKDIQLDKLKLYCRQHHEIAVKKSLEAVEEALKNDPSAHTKDQLENLKYVTYQRQLATNPKVGENINRDIIRVHLYETPVFDNPFKASK